MSSFGFLVLCIQACLILNAFSATLGLPITPCGYGAGVATLAEPFGFAGPLGLGAPAAPFGYGPYGIGAPEAFGFGAGYLGSCGWNAGLAGPYGYGKGLAGPLAAPFVY